MLPQAAEVRTPHGGTVVRVGTGLRGYGNSVDIQRDDGNDRAAMAI